MTEIEIAGCISKLRAALTPTKSTQTAGLRAAKEEEATALLLTLLSGALKDLARLAKAAEQIANHMESL